MLYGYVRGTGHIYPDGLEAVEIHISRSDALGSLPVVEGQRNAIILVVDGLSVRAGLRETPDNPMVWICPDAIDAEGKSTTLAALFHELNIHKNQRVALNYDGTQLTMIAATAGGTHTDVTSRQAVLDAVAEYDQIGQRSFLEKYGFRAAKDYFLVHDAREYDSKAILGAAHNFQYPHLGPLNYSDFSGGSQTVRVLNQLGFEVRRRESHTISASAPFSLPDEINPDVQLIEGKPTTITVNADERSSKAREKCISHYGTNCVICDFSFGAVYGDEADGYIHVHHVRPLSERREYVVDPVKDLRPVCPNCHAVLHLGTRTRSVEEVKALLSSFRGNLDGTK